MKYLIIILCLLAGCQPGLNGKVNAAKVCEPNSVKSVVITRTQIDVQCEVQE